MNVVFYSSRELQEKFSKRVSEENDSKAPEDRKSPSEVVRELQELYIKYGDNMINKLK